MPVGGKLVLKGGLRVKSSGVGKPKKKKQVDKEAGEDGKQEELKTAQGISVMSNKTYEDEFALEMEKAKQGKAKSTPWGSGYRAPPPVLHGYQSKVSGKTPEERLDIRAAMKSDKFCK